MNDDAPEDLYRWCIYCGADCYPEDPEHAADCPSATGLWPVRENMLKGHPGCPDCKCGGTVCDVCDEPFKAGDFYVLVGGERKPETQVPGIEGAYFAGVVTCVGCAALAEERVSE